LKNRDKKSPLAKIIGTGSFLPPNQYSTEEMKKYFPQIDLDWARENIGVRTRYLVRNFETGEMNMTNSEMTSLCAEKIMRDAEVNPDQIDLIVVVTASPDFSIPNMACQVQHNIKAKKAASIGILSGCGGFVTGLTTACQFIENGSANRALVIGSDIPSAYVDLTHPKFSKTQWMNAVIFGDGAGGVLLEATEEKNQGISHSYIGSDGRNDGPFIIPSGGSKIRPNEKVLEEGLHFVNLKYKDIVGGTPKYMRKSIDAVLSESGLVLGEIDWLVPHQPTMRIINKFVKKIGLPSEKALIYVDKVGNLSDAMIPVSLDLARREGKLKKGDVILLAAAGAGWMFGANILKWSL